MPNAQNSNDSTKSDNYVDNVVQKSASVVILDIRLCILLLIITVCGTFFAGLTFGPDVVIPFVSKRTATTSRNDGIDKKKSAIIQTRTNDNPILSPQNLFIDIKGIDSEFLRSEEKLVQAAIQFVESSGWTMITKKSNKSFQSQTSDGDGGIAFVGKFESSLHGDATFGQISFHTQPKKGIITLNLFHTDIAQEVLTSKVAAAKQIFGIVSNGDDENGSQIEVNWAQEFREGGILSNDGSRIPVIDANSDLATIMLSPIDVYMKREVLSSRTKYHRVDIWELLQIEDTPGQAEITKYNLQFGDSRLNTPELSTPDTCIFVDGHLKVTSSNFIQMENLVHPAMFLHANPQNVAIMGCGQYGMLREVLKHNTIKSVTMLEKDEHLFRLSQQYLPELSDCSNLAGRNENCFDDPMFTVIHEDPVPWFIQQYQQCSSKQAQADLVSESDSKSDLTPTLFDVIIIDDWDDKDGSDALLNHEDYIPSLISSLSYDGVLLLQVGVAPDIDQPRANMGVNAKRELLFQKFEHHPDVGTMLVYDELRTSDYYGPVSYLLVCKTAGHGDKCRQRWYERHDLIDFEIYNRIIPNTQNDKNNQEQIDPLEQRSLKYYDGVTQKIFSDLPKAWETLYCRREPVPIECDFRYLDSNKEVHELNFEKGAVSEDNSDFEVKLVKDTENNEILEVSVISKADIQNGSYIMPSHLVKSWSGFTNQRDLDEIMQHIPGDKAQPEDVMSRKQCDSGTRRSSLPFVEVGGTTLIRTVSDAEQANVGRWFRPPSGWDTPVYSPVYERHRHSLELFMVAIKDIPAGTELLKYQEEKNTSCT